MAKRYSGMTIARAREILTPLGIVIKRTDPYENEWRVNFRDGAESTATYETDISSAVLTGQAMAAHRTRHGNPAPRRDRLTGETFAPLTAYERDAIRAYAASHGRDWKEDLSIDWSEGRVGPELQSLRNTHGPGWLTGLRLKDLDREPRESLKLRAVTGDERAQRQHAEEEEYANRDPDDRERNPAPRGGRRAPDRGGPLSSAEKFFYDHAGFSYDPKTETKEQGRRRVAKKLAAAEAKAEEKEWSVEWEHEQDPDISWMDEEQLADYENGRIEMLSATLYDAEGRVIGSLGGNALDGRSSSRNPQARVIEAELALEALGDAS